MGKKSKSKVVYCTTNTFSKKFESLFNNKKQSDFTVKLEEKGEVIDCHKLVLVSTSTFFEKLILGDENVKEYTFPKEESEQSVKDLLKFLYTGSLDYTDDSNLVQFTLLANKYKVKYINEFKIPGKALLNGILTYVEKDLEKRQSEFEGLCEMVDFKKFEKEDLQKIYKKKKWLQKSTAFLNVLILKDTEDSDEGSGSDKDSDEESGSDKSDSESESEEEESSGGVSKWDKKLSSTYYTFSNKDKTCTYTYSSSSWYGTAVGKKAVDKYAVKLGSSATYVMIGYADPSKLNKSYSNYSNGGHYYYPSGSSLYGVGSVGSFQNGDCNQGTIYGFKYDKKKGEITIYKNGQLMGIAFKGIKKLKLHPVLDAYYGNSTYEFVKPKFNKK